mmetsp:Transcript_11401/g.22610  ORF Transcript_11401/g.22610 Transcript_11401/m.22610 type:complete len:203 (-) Transcript_11401:163-771(-)
MTKKAAACVWKALCSPTTNGCPWHAASTCRSTCSLSFCSRALPGRPTQRGLGATFMAYRGERRSAPRRLTSHTDPNPPLPRRTTGSKSGRRVSEAGRGGEKQTSVWASMASIVRRTGRPQRLQRAYFVASCSAAWSGVAKMVLPMSVAVPKESVPREGSASHGFGVSSGVASEGQPSESLVSVAGTAHSLRSAPSPSSPPSP